MSPRSFFLAFGVVLLVDASAYGEAPTQKTDLYGDPLPAGAIARMGTVRWRHTGDVQSVVFSPDGKSIASTCSETDEFVWLWDAATGRLIRQIKTEGRTLVHAFMPDGKAILLQVGNVLALHDVSSGRQLRRFPETQSTLGGVALARNGTCLAYGSGETILRLHDPASGRELRRLDVGDVHDSTSRRERRRMEELEKGVTGVALAPDGKFVASVGHDDTIRLWNTVSGKCLRTLRREKPCVPVFAPDGRTLAWGDSKGLIRLLDVMSGRILRTIKAQKGSINSLSFSPDGKLLASGGSVVHLWDPETGEESTESKRAPIDASHAIFAPVGKTLLLGMYTHTLHLWDVDKWRARPSPEGHVDLVQKLAMAPDGKSLLSTSQGGTIRLWELSTGHLRRCWRQTPRLRDTAFPVAFAPDGQTFAAADDKGIVRIRETSTGRQLSEWRTGESYILGLAYAPDGRRLALSGHRLVQVWDTAEKTCIRQRKQQNILFDPITGAPIFHELFFTSKRARLLFWSKKGFTATLWDVDSDDKREVFGGVGSVAHSLDGKTLTTHNKSIGEDTLQLWETTADKERKRLRTKVNFSGPMAFTPDGRTLVAAHADGGIRLMSVITGAEVQHLRNRVEVTAMTFAPDGKSLITAHADTTILVWDVSTSAGRDDFAALARVDLEKAWIALAGGAVEAHVTVWQLAGDPKQSVPFLAERLHAALAPPREQFARWIAELDSDHFVTRQRATAELEKCGDTIVEPLRAALRDKPSLEVRRRLEPILESARVWHMPLAGELLRSVRAVEVLEHIGTVEARRVLEKLAAGAKGAFLTEEA